MKANKIGKCIYCLSDEAVIDEHIVPKSLGGITTLQKASCKKCADVTSGIINKVTHSETSLFGRARIIMDSPTRRKNKRPTHLQQTILTQENQVRSTQVKKEDYIDTIQLPIYPEPTIFSNKITTDGIQVDEIQLLHSNLDKAKPGIAYRTHQRMSNADLPRLLALIAYVHAVSIFGLDRISTSHLLDTIFLRKEDAGTWIGTAKDNVMKLEKSYVQIAYQENNGHIIYRVKFFSWLTASPEYIIVVI